MLGGWGDALGAGVRDLRDALTCRLDQLRTVGERSAAATTGTARTLAYQFGSPPEVGARNLAPRSMTLLPYIWEPPEEVAAPVRLDFMADAGRYVSSGFYANLGDTPARVVLIGVDGQSSAVHTLPAGATVQLNCFLSGMVVQPGEDGPVRVQVYVS